MRISAILIIIFSFCLPLSGYAFGITPGNISNDRLLPGSTTEETFFLTRTTSDTPLDVQVKKEFTDAGSWVTINPNEIRFQVGETKIPITMNIAVPKKTPSGHYRGTYQFIEKNGKPLEINGNTSLAGGTLTVQLSVTTTPIKDFSLLFADSPITQPPRKFLFWTHDGRISLPLTIQNTGNTPVAPKKIEILLYQDDALHPIETATTFNTEIIPPFTTKKIFATFSYDAPPGEYLVKTKVFQDYRLAAGGEISLVATLPQKITADPIISFFKKMYYSLVQ